MMAWARRQCKSLCIFPLTVYRNTDIIKTVMNMTIQQFLREKNMSRYQLSKESGVPWATLADICSGKTHLEKCSAGTVAKLAKALGVPMERLLELRAGTEGADGRPEGAGYLESGLPASVQKAIDEYVQGEKEHVLYLDCLWGELYGAINANQWGGCLTVEQADYLRTKYLFADEGA